MACGELCMKYSIFGVWRQFFCEFFLEKFLPNIVLGYMTTTSLLRKKNSGGTLPPLRAGSLVFVYKL